jgi:hypothetical protein
MTHPSTAESPMPWTADALANHISDVLAENYYEPEGALPEVGIETPEEEDKRVIWVESPGSTLRMAVVVVEVEGGERPVHVTLGD